MPARRKKQVRLPLRREHGIPFNREPGAWYLPDVRHLDDGIVWHFDFRGQVFHVWFLNDSGEIQFVPIGVGHDETERRRLRDIFHINTLRMNIPDENGKPRKKVFVVPADTIPNAPVRGENPTMAPPSETLAEKLKVAAETHRISIAESHTVTIDGQVIGIRPTRGEAELLRDTWLARRYQITS